MRCYGRCCDEGNDKKNNDNGTAECKPSCDADETAREENTKATLQGELFGAQVMC
jgi:hypothetical protein